MAAARHGDGPPAPTVLRIVLGKRLQMLREKAGFSFDDAARVVETTSTTIRRMENAEVLTLRPPYARALLEAYGVSGDDIEAFLALARDAKRPGWWRHYRDAVPAWFSAFVSLEEAASLIRAYEPHYVPGLLQTEEYARAVLRAGSPHAPDEEIERRLALRMKRQDVLTRPDPPRLWVVMDETALRRPVGSTALMQEQMARLTDVGQSPAVTVQVMPFSAGAHPAMYGPIHYFRFRIPDLPDIACTETLTDATYLDDRDEVSEYHQALDRMCAQAAPPAPTLQLIKESYP